MLPQGTILCSAEKARRKLRLLCRQITRCIAIIAFNASQSMNPCSAFFFYRFINAFLCLLLFTGKVKGVAVFALVEAFSAVG